MFIALVIIIIFAGAISPVAGLKVTGVILQGTGAPGDHVSFDMDVGIGKNDTPINLTLDILDWQQGLTGENLAVDSHPSPYSAKDMLTVTPKSFHLEPNGTQHIVVDANIPKDAEPGGRYAMISVHRAAEKVLSTGSINTELAVNTLVLITVSAQDSRQTGEISGLSMNEPASGKQPEGSLIFNNTGNVLFRIHTDEVLKDKSGKVVANTSVSSDSSILPGAARIIKFSFQPNSTLQPGIYTLGANVSLEDGTALAAKSAEFNIK